MKGKIIVEYVVRKPSLLGKAWKNQIEYRKILEKIIVRVEQKMTVSEQSDLATVQKAMLLVEKEAQLARLRNRLGTVTAAIKKGEVIDYMESGKWD